MSETPRRYAPIVRLVASAAILVTGVTACTFAWRALHLRRAFDHGAVAPLPMLVIALILVALGLVAAWVPMRWMEHRPFRTLGFALRPRAARDALLGLLGGGLTPAIVALGFLAAGAATITPAAPDLLATTLPMIAAMTLISSWEEIALRGYFMQVVAAMGGPWVAASLSGLVFGLIHAGNPGANPMGLAITALNGVLLALLVVRTGSLWLACGYHAGWNLAASIGFGMVDSGMRATGAFATTTLRGSAFWTGGSYGFEASIVAFVVEAVVLLVLLRVAPRVTYDAEAQPYYAPANRHRSALPAALATALLAACVGGVEPASAQESAPLVHPGARVRVFVIDTTRTGAHPAEAPDATAPARSRQLIASLVEFRKDAVVVRRNGHEEPAAIPLDRIRRLEVSTQRTSKAHAGALIGLGAGIAGGVLTAIVVCEDGQCEEAEGSYDYTGLVAAVFGLGGGLAGAGLGALTGSLFHAEEWRAVPLPSAQLGLRTRGKGDLRAALTLHF